ncbi:DUF979 domain-containing protein [Rudaea cellulosilytica]|uniref:DUF979 domain-containing protein n=1 Tax=Rudaea cellulosilytica TaxID=540746 RepID=UPI00036982FE|nr:DUF979 domain-containing protein [Rudaea cellulosilytica]
MSLRLEYIYWLMGIWLVLCAIYNLRERRWAMATFWALVGCAFLFGDAIKAASAAHVRWPAQMMGLGVVALGLLAASGTMQKQGSTDGERRDSAERLGNRLFLPALTIPFATIALVLTLPRLSWQGAPLIDATQATLISLGLACVLAAIVAVRTTRAPATQALAEGRRLLDTLGCVALLPMVLATLGGVFAATGVGDAVAAIVGAVIPVDSRIACLVAFALGMVLFTMIMGNAFAAFPVMMAGIGLPLLVHKHGAAPAVLGSLGMLTGYCGTLLTPMAANFNIVPAVLLELRDQYAVIRAQWPTALVLLVVNVILMAVLVFR